MIFEQEKTEETENDMTSVLSVPPVQLFCLWPGFKILSEIRDFFL